MTLKSRKTDRMTWIRRTARRSRAITSGTTSSRERKILLLRLNDLVDRWPQFLSIDADFPTLPTRKNMTRFGLGTLRNAEGGIDFTASASKRAMEILFWVAAMHIYDGKIDPGQTSKFDDFFWMVDGEENTFLRKSFSIGKKFFGKGKFSWGTNTKQQGQSLFV